MPVSSAEDAAGHFANRTIIFDVKVFIMSSSNILRLLRDALTLNGERLDLVSGDTLKIRPNANDTGAINIGDGTYDIDVKTFLGASTKYVLLDVGNSRLQLEDVDQLFGDTDKLIFGDGSDVTLQWDGTRLVGSAAANAMWDGCPSPADPNYSSQVFEVFDDFTHYDPTASTGDWPETAFGTGTQALLADVAGGVLRLSCQATTDDACEQMTYVSDPFKLAAGKTLWYETRVKITGDVQSEHSFGLAALGEDLTAVPDVLPQDGVSFSTQDASLAAALTASKNGTNTGAVAGVHTLVTATWVTLGFKIDGVTSCTPYVNGVAGTAATATFCDDESLAPYFLVRNGDATTTQILDIDYVKVVQLR